MRLLSKPLVLATSPLIRYFLAMPLLLIFALSGCVSAPSRNALPEDSYDQVTLPGGPTARMWGDAAIVDVQQRIDIFKQQFAHRDPDELAREERFYLSISGGGASGAFAAGLLKGWTESGTRPEMWVVTGISTGALIAPFAFLGSDYDEELETLYTNLSTSDLIKKRFILRGLTSDALADTQPLRELLREYVDQEMISDIAREYSRGRRLLIGTTNLDAERPVIWNIGAIATEGTAESAQLIRDVMLASASVPGMFPPVRITVQAEGQEYDELHVDGGVTSQVFFYPAQLNMLTSAAAVGLSANQSIFIIRNGVLAPSWDEVSPKLGSIVSASIETLIRTQGLGDLYRIYLGAKRDEMPFHLAFIPSDFDRSMDEAFDPKYMRSLFEMAYQASRNGYDWADSPPGTSLP